MTQSPAKTRHLSAEEQAVMSKALRASVKVVDPSPSEIMREAAVRAARNHRFDKKIMQLIENGRARTLMIFPRDACHDLAQTIAALPRPADPRDAEIERLRKALEETTGLLKDWCDCIATNGTAWDDWDECYKAACYEPNQYNPNRGVIARARAALNPSATPEDTTNG